MSDYTEGPFTDDPEQGDTQEKVLSYQQKEKSATLDKFEAFKNSIQGETFKPIRTGVDFYDQITEGGAQVQTLTVLVAKQGSGKSLLFQQIAESLARQGESRRVVYLNFEMSYSQLLARAISARLSRRGIIHKTQKQVLRGYEWTEAEREEIEKALEEYEFESAPYISYNPEQVAPSVEALEAYYKKLIEDSKLTGQPAPVLFLDYLQLIQSDKAQDTKDKLTQTLLDLKSYCIEGNTFAFLISAARRGEDHITAESARDTSSIEYTSDYLLSLEDAEGQAEANYKGRQRMVLKMLKSRDGETGKAQYIERDGANCIFKGERRDTFAGGAPRLDRTV